MYTEIEALKIKLTKAIELNDKESILKINEELDNIILYLLTADNRQVY